MLPVVIEVDMSEGLPVLDMVGLLNSEVKEAKERVRTAIKNAGITIPPKRITINLSPADIRKEGGAFDLPIALGILCSMGKLTPVFDLDKTIVVGELSLSGNVKPIRGAIAIASSARDKGYERIIVPGENGPEASVVQGIEVISVENLNQMIEVINGNVEAHIERFNIEDFYKGQNDNSGNINRMDFDEVNGQEGLKRAAMIAAAGRHNLLIVGSPGSGKTMVAERIPTILPRPLIEECIEITKIHSIAGELDGKSIMTHRPFRSPHHTVTPKAMTGGGYNVKPGEITLAHKGVLFLDEMAEYDREALEVLRQPLESRKLTINRISGTYEFPADIMLVAATNPCRCGYYPDRRKCKCTEHDVRKYMSRISGPILNRIDIMVGATEISVDMLQKNEKNISSEDMKKKVEAARMIQMERYKGTTIGFNSNLSSKDVKKYCYLGAGEKKLLREALEKLNVSPRAYYKIIKVARTIADIDGSNNIEGRHLAEALGYRTSSISDLIG